MGKLRPERKGADMGSKPDLGLEEDCGTRTVLFALLTLGTPKLMPLGCETHVALS